MEITFVGTSSCIPDIGSETASFVINGRHLVDTGWCAVLRMRRYGLDPLGLESIILTHLHQDHYIGLAQLLFYIGLKRHGGAAVRPLHIIGPGEHLAHVVNAALEFLQIPRFPELKVDYILVPLSPGHGFEFDDLRLETCAAQHVSGEGVPEPALAYRVTENTTGVSFTFTGDTSFHPPIAKFAKGSQLLIHDAAHTSARDAATIARMAGVKRLLLIHYSQSEADSLLAAARDTFPETYLASEGDTIAMQ